eukprot:s8297_g2.t1
MAPKFGASRRDSASSSSRAPTPRVAKIAKVDVSMTLSALPFGLNGSYVSEGMSNTACHVWILDLNAPATKVYDGSVQWAEHLKCEHRKTNSHPVSSEDLANFGMAHICGTKPNYLRFLFSDNGADGWRDAFWLFRGFVEFLCVAPSHAKKLQNLTLRVPNCTSLPMVNFDVKMNTALTLTTILSTSEYLTHHPCELRHPDRRGYAHLSFHAAPEDVVEEVRPRLADEDDGPLYIPQFTGCWWGLRDVLREAGFEDVTEEGLTFARKTFQAAAVTEKGGQAWLQAFIQALAETPLLVTFEPSMKLFKNLLDLPYVLQQQQQP